LSLLYASTFTKALDRLAAAEQKQVKITTVDLMLDATGNGLQMHRIESAPGFWSVRVNQDVRIILHKEGETTLLAYVDHHDDAYRWAERRRLVPHERTGAMQLVEIVERTEPRLVPDNVDAPLIAEPVAVHRPFAALSDDDLLNVGVPGEWLEVVRTADEASVDGLFSSLPDEAAEALLDFATGGRLQDHMATQPTLGADPFAHPDAQRRFRAVEGLEELKAALDAPFAQWAVFLHPAQRASVTRDWRGPARVSGSAGTGKTIVALHRAVHLAERADAHVLLTTFSKPLAASLGDKVTLMTEARSELRRRLTVRSIDQAAYELYATAFGQQPNLATASHIRAGVKAAVDAGHGSGHSPAFLYEEWDELVDAWDLRDAEAYAAVPRIGRRTRLGPKQRESAWAVFAFIRERLATRGVLTMADVYGRLTRWVADGGAFPFSHVVVDEAQDLSVAQARFLAAIGRAGSADALFFTGDLGQRIFHLPFSWAKLGLDVRGRAQVLKVCYRTSHQIRRAADRLLATVIADQDGIEESRGGTVSVFDGPEPLIKLFDDTEAERTAVGAWLAGMVEGTAQTEVAILIRGEAQLGRGRAAAKAAGAAIPVITMHEAKGLEFRAVAVMALDEDVLPNPERLAGIGDMADLEAVHDAERHLLYVAATRARDNLMLSGVSPGSDFLDDLVKLHPR